MKCEIISFEVPTDPRAAFSPVRMCFQCNTHHWADVPLTFGPQLCPIGKIEQAVEDGLEKIKQALQPASPCVFRAGPDAWCQTHGWDCPNNLPTVRK